ncbi:hypothetical protein DFH27DRAFT_578664 [Peziza echinospora]|nr:hypothetical protein DFH27DRAFT_578664 [Peziza echinospora]
MAIFNYVLLATAMLASAPSLVAAQNKTQQTIISPAFAKCQTDFKDAQCGTFNIVDDCITKAQSNFWDLFDQYAYGSKPVKDTPLGTALQNSRVKVCICDRNTLKNIETCVKCVRKEAKITDSEKIDVYDLGFVIGESCGITLEAFSGKSENKAWTSTTASTATVTTSSFSAKNTSTTRSNTTATAFVNSTTTALPTTTSTSIVLSTTPTPTPSATKTAGSGSPGQVWRHVLPGALLGAMVAAMMSLL